MQDEHSLILRITERRVADVELGEDLTRVEREVLRRPDIRFLHVVFHLCRKRSRRTQQEYRHEQKYLPYK